ncbi:15 kDa protein B-like, partial [Myotis lucifugus]|uniref:15 kDa protein B-like n=1 Tax=Myotis lucifugus TaxID=59463 RepID=UPI000CCC8B56
MAGAWRALVLVAGLAAMACEAQHRRLPPERIATQALHFFNAGRQGQPLFGLLEVLPTVRSNSTLRTLVRFRIKETVCLSGRRQQPEPQQCAFRDGGEERNCTST